MSIDNKHIQNIINAKNDSSLAIFVGAGISKSSETESFKLPDWADLIKDLKTELDIQDEFDFLKIAQLYYLEFGEFIYYKKLKEYFPDYIKPSELHKLIFRINPHVIITTNWDNILERTIEENAFIYDTISSDTDLTRSSLQNKVIKMHGDFTNNNIVFKEDDYINYQLNFPLLENYLKSILSTHTVLFIGYSYNDFNLKQILKWIQKHSEVRPPMYLTTFHKNDTSKKYFENHGVTSLNIANEPKSLINFASDYSCKTYSFLDRINNQNESSVVKSESLTLDFILSKLKIFSSLEGLLLDQIQTAFSNCGFLFDEDERPILKFYQGELTGDYDQTRRNIYQNFVSILQVIDEKEKKPSARLIDIFKILSKSDIKGIVLRKEEKSPYREWYIEFSKYLGKPNSDRKEKHLNFDYSNINKSNNDVIDLLEYSFNLQQIGQLEESFQVVEEAISLCLKQRIYPLLFVAMYNRNSLLWKLKYSLGKKDIREKFSEVEEYDLKERFYNLPQELRVAIEPIYNFVDESSIISYAYRIAEDLKKTEDSKRTIESGGMVFGSEVTKYASRHNNLINFVLRNTIMVEGISAFKSINRHFVVISLHRQVQQSEVILTQTELFACIKYIELKDLKVIFNDFYNGSDKSGKFRITETEREWLVNNVFRNIVKLFLSSQEIFNKYDGYIQNTLLILSVAKHSKKQFEAIVKIIARIIAEGNNTFSIFKSINLFLGIQYNLFKSEIEPAILLEMIENLINRLITKKFNGHEYRAITTNELNNLYIYAREKEVIFDNYSMVDRLIGEIKDYNISDKIEVSQNLLLSIYDMSTERVKELIKDFILKIDTKKEKELYKRVIFKLTLAIYGLKDVDKSLKIDLDNYLSELKEKKIFSSALFMIKSQIEYLNQKDRKVLTSQLDEINKMIELHENRENLSIF
ncbi:SIR2 family protein [Algoriphagus algorifonticola]|uniref:SIR2 family protein n=1 Tax=Algoriphagus algorifonticola TaxID=2593007 RepID=UPI0011A31E87|nr:SIR2 family protein [Algoriphagus algorifonticola]